MLQSFFYLTPVELDQLGSEPAVAVLREMLWAEANNLGVPISQIDVPFAVTTSDGGIDAIVNGTPQGPGNGLIFAPRTAYQVKAGAFPLNATSPGTIEELLISPSAIKARIAARIKPSEIFHKADDISPRVRACLDVGGTFVVMLFGNDSIDTEEDATEGAIRDFLAKIDGKYATAQIKVWRQSRICGILRAFPAISLQIKNLSGLQLLTHKQWAERYDLRQEFVAAPDQQMVIDTLRTALRDDSSGPLHVRVIGEPGIGKTRLVLETLRADDLKPLVLYADRGTKVDGSVISAIYNVKNARIILVVDECNPDVRSDLVRNFASLGARVKIISIYQDRDQTDDASEYRLSVMPPLPTAEIETILRVSYDVDPAYVSGWATLCEGSPRVAHVIGQNLREHPEDPLRSDGTAQIWNRFLAADVGRDTEDYRIRHLVISSLALFKKFGFGHLVRTQALEVYDLIVAKLDGGISKARFSKVIEQMATRKVLQGDHFLYITPRALHIKLWIDWWNENGASINVNEIIPALTPQMRQWFAEMIEYAEATQVSKRLVEHLLGPDGLYKDSEWLNTREGGRFFFSLSLASPPHALRLLERTIGRMDRDVLLKFEAGRRDVISALEGIALHSDLFTSSARLLLALADAENETWSNNATGVFKSLFSLGYGQVAPTSLAPEHRLPVLVAALKESDQRARIALGAFEKALSMQSISRMGGDEPFRLRGQITRWTPKTYGEWFAAFRLYWQTLRNSLGFLSGDRCDKAAAILVSRSRELLRVEDLRAEILDTFSELSGFSDKRQIIAAIEDILSYDAEGMPAELASQLIALRDQLIGQSFHSRLQRYAGMDLLQDQFDRTTGKQIDKTESDIRNLAEETVANPDILVPELQWLVTREAKNGYRFGYALGQLDMERIAWRHIHGAYISAGDNADGYFVGGYLRAVFERESEAWEAIITSMAAEEVRLVSLPSLVWRSGMSHNAAKLLLQLVQSGKIAPETLGVFAVGRGTDQLSDQMLAEWLDALMDVGTLTSASVALDLASMAMHGGRVFKAPQLAKIIAQPALSARKGGRADGMLAHHWLQLSKELVKLDPQAENIVLSTLLKSMSEEGSLTDSLGPEGDQYLDELVSKHPSETWRIVSEYVKPPLDVRGFVFTRWLRGDMGFNGRDPGPMRHIPRGEIWTWIEADPDSRAAYVANMAPKDFTVADWPESLIRGILCRFGDNAKVQSAVTSNFFTGGWHGPASVHYEMNRDTLSKLKQKEANPHAMRWLNTAIEITEKNLEAAKIEEEARGY